MLALLGNLFKGQLKSEWIYGVIISSEIPTKNYRDFCPGSLLDGRTEISAFLVGISQTNSNSFVYHFQFESHELDFISCSFLPIWATLAFFDHFGLFKKFISYFQFEAEELDFTSCSVPHCLVTRNTLSRWRQAAIKMFKFPIDLPMTLHLCPEADREKW